MVAVRFEAVSVVVVFSISIGVTQLLVDFCHLTTVPVCPERVRSVLFVPEQTGVPPVIEPPILAGSTVTFTGVATLVQPPEVTVLRK